MCDSLGKDQQCKNVKKKPWYERGCLVGSLDSGLFWGGRREEGVYFSLSELFHKRHWCKLSQSIHLYANLGCPVI